jgi:hypothetical protein
MVSIAASRSFGSSCPELEINVGLAIFSREVAARIDGEVIRIGMKRLSIQANSE